MLPELAARRPSRSWLAWFVQAVTVTSSSLITLNEQLTINPGGHTVTVVLNISL